MALAGSVELVFKRVGERLEVALSGWVDFLTEISLVTDN